MRPDGVVYFMMFYVGVKLDLSICYKKINFGCCSEENIWI